MKRLGSRLGRFGRPAEKLITPAGRVVGEHEPWPGMNMAVAVAGSPAVVSRKVGDKTAGRL